MNEQTEMRSREVLIEEFYTQEGDNIYRIWRFNGGEWQKQLTPLLQFPTMKVVYPRNVETDWRDIKYGEDT